MFQQVGGDLGFAACRIIAHALEHIGQQAVAALNALRRLIHRKIASTRKPRKQQCIGQRLCIGIGKLAIIGIRKKEAPPIFGQAAEVRGRVFHCVDDFIAQQAADRRKHLGQALGRTRRDCLPGEVGLKQLQQCGGIIWLHGPRTIVRNIARKPHTLAEWLASAKQRPLITIGIDQVGQVLELFPLLLVLAPQRLGPGTLAGCFQFHIADQRTST